jgi:hypothetical protein
MEIVKGRKPQRTERANEDRFRYPADEEIWEISYSQECECKEREVPRSPRGTSSSTRRAAYATLLAS